MLENQSYFNQTIKSQVGKNFREIAGIKELNYIANEFVSEFMSVN